jgi:hypothetical protein
MSEATLQAVQRYLAQFLSGENSLSQFRDWFDAETWDLDMEPGTPLGQIVGEIELRLAEFTNGHRTEDDLRYHLESLLPKAENVDFQLQIMREEPLVEMISS